MLSWRILLTFIGTFFGAIIGIFIVDLTERMDALVSALLSGAFLGAVCGWTITPITLKAVDRLKERLAPTPPPREVLRLGWSLGFAEGIVVGATQGGILAAVCGGYLGLILGLYTAALAWYVRRHISLLLLALSLGFLIEVGGCLLIVFVIKLVAFAPFMMWILSGEIILLLLLRLRFEYRRSKFTKQEESLDPPGP